MPGVVTSANVSVTLGSQASVAVAVAKLGVAGQSIVVGAGNAEITGAVRSSRTVNFWTQLTEILLQSVAV